MTGAWYNENDPFAAAWLRELIREGAIADGVVDERSIVDVRPDELRAFAQCHFFAGVGVWSYAIRLAGWPDDRPVWTGSCPCQPFSAAGKGGGFDDERHLWPAFHWLIEQCGPDVVFGEQVASKDGLAWLDLVHADLEGTGYASGAVDLCAAGIGAPHIRQRLWWFAERLENADAGIAQQPARQWPGSAEKDGGRPYGQPAGRGDAGGLADAERADGRGQYRDGVGGTPREGEDGPGQRQRLWPDPADGGADGRLAHAQHHDRRSDIARRGSDQRAADGGCGGAVRLADAEAARSSHGRTGAIQPELAKGGGRSGGLADADRQGVSDHRRGGADGEARGDEDQERQRQRVRADAEPDGDGDAGRLADAQHDQQRDGGRPAGQDQARDEPRPQPGGCGSAGGLAEPLHPIGRPLGIDGQDGRDGQDGGWPEAHGDAGTRGEVRGRPGPVNGLWRDADWLLCRDGRWRPVEPGTFPLAHGSAARVGRLRGYGNAINAEAAAAFVEAWMTGDLLREEPA